MATVRLDRRAVEAYLRGSTGPVAADLLRRGRQVEAEAKRLCPVDTNRLRSSIGHQLITDGGALSVRVGTNVDYALFVHEGTRPHIIRPRTKKALAFVWPNAPGNIAAGRPKRSKRGKSGPFVVLAYVQHPGTRARPFLVDALARFRP